jgi:hypothetical protein
MHQALLNDGFLLQLLEADIFAILALGYRTCNSLENTIFHRTLTPTIAGAHFRRLKFALHHDNYDRHFSAHERFLLRYTIHHFQDRYGDTTLLEAFAESLGPIISRTPPQMFWQSPGLSPDFEVFIENPLHRGKKKGRPYDVSAKEISDAYKSLLGTPWMYATWLFTEDASLNWVEKVNEMQPHPVLKPRFLLSKLYIELYTKSYALTMSANLQLFWTPWSPKKDATIVETVDELLTIDTFPGSEKISSILQKWCVREYVEAGVEGGYISWETYCAVVGLSGWDGLWTDAERGAWLALALRQFGTNVSIEQSIEAAFPTTLEGIVWIFLGAHGWFDPREQRVEDTRASDETKVCHCFDVSGMQDRVLPDFLKGLGVGDRVWIIEQAVRRAQEFGVCRDLGATLFHYLVEDAEDDRVFEALVKEICGSRIQELFEHSIGLAIGDCEEERRPKPSLKTKELKHRLKVRDGELFQLLDGGNIEVRKQFYVIVRIPGPLNTGDNQ